MEDKQNPDKVQKVELVTEEPSVKVELVSKETLVSKAPVLTEIPHWSKFLDTRGMMRTMSLFQEMAYEGYPFFFNLGDFDKPTSYSLKRLYIQESDPVEYTFATKYFGSYPHWQRMCRSAWFGPVIEEWRMELKAKIHSEAIKKVQAKAEGGDLVAMKYLADFASDKAKRGRPTKNPVRQITPAESDLEADFLRINNEDNYVQ